MKLTEKPDGWYLTVTLDRSWRDEVRRKLVTTELLGRAVVPNAEYEEPDGSEISVKTDYLGNKRNKKNPFPGPFENARPGTMTVKVWPQSGDAETRHIIMKTIPFEDITPDGLLKARAELAFRRLQEQVLSLGKHFTRKLRSVSW